METDYFEGESDDSGNESGIITYGEPSINIESAIVTDDEFVSNIEQLKEDDPETYERLESFMERLENGEQIDESEILEEFEILNGSPLEGWWSIAKSAVKAAASFSGIPGAGLVTKFALGQASKFFKGNRGKPVRGQTSRGFTSLGTMRVANRNVELGYRVSN